MGTSLWDGKPTMTIASLRLDGSGWSQSWQFVVTRENLWLCAGCEGEEVIVFFIRYPRARMYVNCLTLKYLLIIFFVLSLLGQINYFRFIIRYSYEELLVNQTRKIS